MTHYHFHDNNRYNDDDIMTMMMMTIMMMMMMMVMAHFRQRKGAGSSTVVCLVGQRCNDSFAPTQFWQWDLINQGEIDWNIFYHHEKRHEWHSTRRQLLMFWWYDKMMIGGLTVRFCKEHRVSGCFAKSCSAFNWNNIFENWLVSNF